MSNVIVEQLKKAREIIANPYAWIKGNYHKRKAVKGDLVDCYCAILFDRAIKRAQKEGN